MSAVGASSGSSHSESTIDKVQTVACCPSNAVIGHPSDQGLIDAALKNQILKEASDGVVYEGGYNRRLLAEASLKRAGDVVLAAAFVYIEFASRPDTLVAGIESQHDLTESNEVPPACLFGFRTQDHSSAASSFGTSMWIKARATRYADPASAN